MTSVALSPIAAIKKLTDRLAQSIGSALIGFVATVGATDRTVQSKLQETVSVSDFGAVGDGVTDDTASLQAAINYAASISTKLISQKKSTFLISDGLSVPAGLVADFGFSTIKRKAGSVFDMLTCTGGSDLDIANLRIDGDRLADGLSNVNPADRFGGVVLNGVTDSALRNVQVSNTVNAEDGRAGVYLGGCTGVDLYDVGGSGTAGSCVLIAGGSHNRIFGSRTKDNLGSGITSSGADDCEYYDCISQNSGYSGISINGLRCKGNNLRATGAAFGFSGINIGHDSVGNRADDSIVSNIHSNDNAGWGLTVPGSARVQLSSVNLARNAKANLRIFSNSEACQISGLNSSDSAEHGVLIQSGAGHKITSGDVCNNGVHGIYVDANCSAVIASDVRVFNNGVSGPGFVGVLLSNAVNCRVDAECFDEQATKTQEYGVWIAGGSANLLSGYLHDNGIGPIRETSSPSYTSRNTRTGTNSLSGAFSASAGSSMVTINNNNARAGMVVIFFPINNAARTLGAVTTGVITVGTSFVAGFSGAALGTESFGYVIV